MTISQKKLDDLRKRGAKIAVKKQPPPTPVNVNVEMTDLKSLVARLLEKVANQDNANKVVEGLLAQIRAGNEPGEVIVEIERNHRGQMERAIFKPIGVKH